jgi:PPOX class probable F420-dependent enzyme
MPSQRTAVELTDAERDELIDAARVMQVASINPDGTPHLVPMWFARDDEGLLVFTTYGKSQKILNLQRDPRVTILMETGTAYNELRGVSIDARAEVVSEPAVTARTLAIVGAKYADRPRPPRPVEPPESFPPQAHKRFTVRIHPLRYRTWDHRKLS